MENIVINVKTQEEYNELMHIYKKKGWTWNSGAKSTSIDFFDDHGNDTCIRYENQFFYSPKEHYEEIGYKIISFQEFLALEKIIGKKTIFKKKLKFF